MLDYLVQIWDSDHTPGGLEFPKGATTARATVKVSGIGVGGVDVVSVVVLVVVVLFVRTYDGKWHTAGGG